MTEPVNNRAEPPSGKRKNAMNLLGLKSGRWGLAVLTMVLIALQGGCSRLYFRPMDPIPPAKPIPLARLPVKTYWMGIVFNGAKIGFSHFSLSDCPEKDRFEIRSEAYFRIRFLMMDKTIQLESIDRVNADLTLVFFDYRYDLDGNQLRLSGRKTGDTLEVNILNRQNETRQHLDLGDRPIYPASAIGLYPVLHGLAVGRHYRYRVYDGQTRRLAQVSQAVAGYEESDLYRGGAYRIKTRLNDQSVTTWMSVHGRPLLEMSLGGVIIAHQEDPATAKGYLAQAALNKNDIFLNYSLIRTKAPLKDPRHLRRLSVRIHGMPAHRLPPSDARQQCIRQQARVTCRIDIDGASRSRGPAQEEPDPHERYLLPTWTIAAHNPEIRRLAREITAPANHPAESARLLMDWMHTHIERKAVDVFTAMDVIEGGAAECQGHALLYAAFERSLGIPCRVVHGIVYSEQYRGFLYHSWNESFWDGRWIAVDPTFGQVPADVTHLKFLEGSEPADLLPIGDLIGKIRMQIIDFQ
jgi:hypothetical protein